MAQLSAAFQWASTKLMLLGSILLMALVLLTCIDVFGRMFGYPVFGAYELMSFMAALIAAAALPDAHIEKRHIGVEIVTSKLKRKTRLFMELITDVLACFIFGIVTWRVFILAKNVHDSGEVSMNLKAPEYLVMGAVGVGFVLFSCAIIITISRTFKKLTAR